MILHALTLEELTRLSADLSARALAIAGSDPLAAHALIDEHEPIALEILTRLHGGGPRGRALAARDLHEFDD